MEGLRIGVAQERREVEEFGKVEERWRKEALEERNKVGQEKQARPGKSKIHYCRNCC